jgi:hypothetical protein
MESIKEDLREASDEQLQKSSRYWQRIYDNSEDIKDEIMVKVRKLEREMEKANKMLDEIYQEQQRRKQQNPNGHVPRKESL